MARRIEVVCGAFLSEEGYVWAFQKNTRSQEVPGKWELPGGKIEPGESANEALLRELKEELDVDVIEASESSYVDWDYPHISIRLRCFLIAQWEGEFVLHEHQSLQLVSELDWEAIDWADADRALIQKLREVDPLFLVAECKEKR